MPVLPHLEWVVEAFWALSSCRPVGFAAGPIPWTAIQQFIEVEGYGPWSAWFLHNCIRHMDGVWLELSMSKEKSGGASGRDQAPKAPPNRQARRPRGH